jgi:alpha-tubulin suppressor-like RCC1 family protein
MLPTNILFYSQQGTTGQLWTWGSNQSGQLGQNTPCSASTSSPATTVDGGSSWCQISAAGNNNIGGLKSDSSLWLWGCLNGASSPILVTANNEKWECIAVGSQSVAATTESGNIYTWGLNDRGQLGNNSTTCRTSPGCLPCNETWCAVGYSSGIKTDGTLWMWGSNYSGVLGNNTSGINLSIPGSVVGANINWSKITGNLSTAAGIKTDGTLWAWGCNNDGQIGDNTKTNRSSPVTVAGGCSNWCTVDNSGNNTAAIQTDGSLWTWGANSNGQLGINNTTRRSSPGSVAGAGITWCQISVATLSMAAIKTDGTLWSWGDNTSGKLGNNSCIDRSSPGTTAGGGTDWQKVVIDSGTAAIKTDGTLWTWGLGTAGFLGSGSSTDRSSPGTVAGAGTTWCQVGGTILGFLNRAAIKNDGTLWTWGNNSGFLGDNTTLNRSSPGTVAGGGTTWCLIGPGSSNAIKCDGSLWAWGRNNRGDIGDGTTINRSSPVLITGPVWCAVDEDYHVLALKTDRSLWAWGDNLLGQIGDNSVICRSSPTTTAGGGNTWCAINAKSNGSLAIKTDSSLWVWGSGLSGEIGNNEIVNKSSPTSVAGGNGWCQATTSGTSVVAVKLDGTLWSWGQNSKGELGTNNTTSRSSPGIVSGINIDWVKASNLGSTAAAIKVDGTIWTWGRNYCGTLGTNNLTSRSSPGTVAGGNTGWCDVEVGSNMTAAINGNFLFYVTQRLLTWGRNAPYGGLGTGNLTNRSSPGTTAGGGTNWCDVSIGTWAGVALKTDGTLWTWGYGSAGQLGNGGFTTTSSPGTIAGGGTTWCQVAAGGVDSLGGPGHSSAIKSDCTLWLWGINGSGQLGNNSVTCLASPVTTAGGGTNWCHTALGTNHSAAIKIDGTLWTWGLNSSGQLGNGTTNNASSPSTTSGCGINWCQLGLGQAHSAAIKTDGTLWTWGSNCCGQLGDGTASATCKTSPGTISGAGTNWRQVQAGYCHTLALKADGSLWSWGLNSSGQLGTYNTTNLSSPICIGAKLWASISESRMGNNSAAISCDGRASAWGLNTNGQLGINSTSNVSSPCNLIGCQTNWKKIAQGGIQGTGIFCTT